jgi:hypothetical protein
MNHALMAIGVESERRSVARSLSGQGPKGESDASIAAASDEDVMLPRSDLPHPADWA